MIHSICTDETIMVSFKDKLGVAELSCLTSYGVNIKGLDKPVYYFNRLKIPPRDEGKGFGKRLMIEVCRIADEKGITILNELNPYGKRDLKQLIKFFEKSGFEIFDEHNTMVRRPRKETA